MPANARLTVVADDLVADSVAVTVATPPLSASGLPVRLRLTFGVPGGGAPASVIVAVTAAGLPTVAFVALAIVTAIVSLPSARLSWRLVRVRLPVALPAGIVMVPAEGR